VVITLSARRTRRRMRSLMRMYHHPDDAPSHGPATDSVQYYKAQKDALLFAISVSKSMLQDPELSDDKKAPTDNAAMAALKCAHQVMQKRIISNPKDKMGILFFGTEKTKYLDLEGRPSNLSYPHCYVQTPLDVPSAEDVKDLRSLIEDEEDPEEILVPSSEGVEIKDFLFCANQIFTLRAPTFGSRRLFIITDNDDPHPGDKDACNVAQQRAQDLYDLGVTIEVFPITHGDKKFDFSKFYNVSPRLDCFSSTPLTYEPEYHIWG
jgi:ATP-dependent DNA helicase 2 subunit 1